MSAEPRNLHRLLSALGLALLAFGGGWHWLLGGWRDFAVAGGVAVAVHGLSIARHHGQGDLQLRWIPWHLVAISASVGLVGPVVEAAPHLLAADLAAYPLPAMLTGAAPAALVGKLGAAAERRT